MVRNVDAPLPVLYGVYTVLYVTKIIDIMQRIYLVYVIYAVFLYTNCTPQIESQQEQFFYSLGSILFLCDSSLSTPIASHYLLMHVLPEGAI
jgi:hypothetical protein